MLEEEIFVLGKGPVVFKERSLPLGEGLIQHKKNCKYLKARHILQHLLGLAGAQILCLKNKMLPGLFQDTKTTIMTMTKN